MQECQRYHSQQRWDKEKTMGIDHILLEGLSEEENEQPIQENIEQEETGELEGAEEGGEQTSEEERAEQEILGEEDNQEGEQEEGSLKKPEEKGQDQTYKVNVNGQEVEVGINDLLNNYNQVSAAQEKFREASRIREQSKSLVNTLKENPLEVLSQLGVDVKKLANEQVAKQVEYELMSEDQKRAHDYKLELDRVNKESESRLELEKRQQREQEVMQEKQKALSAIESTIDANPQLPKNNWTISKMAKYMADFKQAGVSDPPMDKIAAKVKSDYEESTSTFIKNMSPEDRAKFLGEKTVRELAKLQGNKYAKNKYSYSTSNGTSEVKSKDPKKGISRSEWRDYLSNIQ
jgi:hypothetical protein